MRVSVGARGVIGLALAALLPGTGGCRRPDPAGNAVAPAPAKAAASEVPVESADVSVRVKRLPGGPPPVIWLGLDGLDWELLDRLAAAGKMPNWMRLVSTGYSTRITSFMPILSPVVWTTLATGTAPNVHRVLDFQEVDPKTGQKVPISGRARRVPAVWNLASAAGKKVGVVGWWATHPAEEVNGFFVSDHASPILYERLSLSGVAFPPALETGIGQTVARESRVSAAEIARFVDVPVAEIEREMASGRGMESPVVALSRILAATRVYQRAARELYDRNQPDLMMLYVEGTDEIGHVFAPSTPPRLACTPEEDVRRYGRVVDLYYALVDRILGQWMRRAEEDRATLLVSSDHGFKWGADRPCTRSSLNWSTAAYWHRLEGVFAAWGVRVRPGRASEKPTMFDVAPTVLALLGLPADRSMPGRPIAVAFRDVEPTARKDLFASVPVRRVPAEEVSAGERSEYAKKLLALGYLSGSETKRLAPTGGSEPGMTEGAWNNLGLYERETTRNLPAARAAFEKALSLRSDYHSPMFNLAILDRTEGDLPRAEDWLFRSFAAGHADPEGTLAGWISWYEDHEKSAATARLLERAVHAYPNNEAFSRALGLARYRRRDCEGALARLAPFESKTSDPATLNYLALFQTCLGNRQGAIALFERSLALKADQPGTIQSLNVLRRGTPPKG